MEITKITDQHLINRIGYFKRILKTYPDEEIYMGDGENGGDWVEQENRQNRYAQEEIIRHVKDLENEAQKRGLEIK